MAYTFEHDTINNMPRNAEGTSTGENYAQCIYELFSAHDNRFTHEAGTDYILVDNKFKIQFFKGGWDHLGFRVLDLNDNIIFSRSTSAGGNNNIAMYNADLLCTTNFFYAYVYSATGTDNGFCFFWHTKNDKNFVGLTLPENGGVLTAGYIENSTIACIEDSSALFKFCKPSDYTLVSPKIAFSNIQLIYGNTGTFSIVDELKSCSLIPFKTTITINGKNYYAIGQNTLLEIES